MAPSSLKILSRYQYDPLDRLTGVGLLERASTRRFYQENYLVTELDGQGQRSIVRHAAQPLAQQQSMAGVSETTLLATDRAHSLLQTLTGNNPQQLAYTAYGHHPAESALSHLLAFNGECPDSITGHYLLGQGKRAYNPVLMRFNSPDDLSPFGEGGINSYAYCGNDPINFHDLTGNARFNTLLMGMNSSRKTVIATNPLYTTQKTAGSIARPDLATSNPTLNKMLDIPSTNSHSRPQSVKFTQKLDVTKTNKREKKAQYSKSGLRGRTLTSSAKKYDKHIQEETPNFETWATEQQQKKRHELTSTISKLTREEVPIAELGGLNADLRRIEMQIKQHSVDTYERAQQIRKK